jgi:hypothetical protein
LGSETLDAETLAQVNLVINISEVAAADIGIADVDQDAIADIMLVNNPGGITTYHYDGSNAFVRDEQVIATTGSTGLGLADLDGDGDIDLIVTSEDQVVPDEILFNAGGGNFGGQTVDLSVSLSAVAAVTVNDSYQVILVVDNNGPGNGDNLLVSYQIGNGELLSFDDIGLNCELLSLTEFQCVLAELEAGSTHSLTLTVLASAVGTMTHQLTVNNDRTDDVADNNQASASTTVNALATDQRVITRGGGGALPMWGLWLLLGLVMWRRRGLVA